MVIRYSEHAWRPIQKRRTPVLSPTLSNKVVAVEATCVALGVDVHLVWHRLGGNDTAVVVAQSVREVCLGVRRLFAFPLQ